MQIDDRNIGCSLDLVGDRKKKEKQSKEEDEMEKGRKY